MSERKTQFVFEAIGTHWQIDIFKEMSENSRSALLYAIMQRIDEFDKNYSRFRDDSFIIHIQSPGRYTLPLDSGPMFDLYKKLYDATEGQVTPLIGNLISDLGYDAQYSLQTKDTLSDVISWNEGIDVSDSQIVIKKPLLIDTGALGKGYLIDIISELIKKNNYADFIVDAGGDIRTESAATRKMRIGLENPENFSQVIGVVEIQDQSICASSGSRRKWGSFHHIINPKTKKSQEGVSATWVIASNTLVADGIATALFFTNAKRLKHITEFEYLILNNDYSFEKSEGFNAEIFIQ